MELKDSHQNQAYIYPTDLKDRIWEGASNIIGILKEYSVILTTSCCAMNQKIQTKQK